MKKGCLFWSLFLCSGGGCHDDYAAELLQKSLSCVGHFGCGSLVYQLKEKVQQKTGFCVKKSDGRTADVRTGWTVIRMSVGRVVATTTGLAILVAIGTGGAGTDAEDIQGLPWQVNNVAFLLSIFPYIRTRHATRLKFVAFWWKTAKTTKVFDISHLSFEMSCIKIFVKVQHILKLFVDPVWWKTAKTPIKF